MGKAGKWIRSFLLGKREETGKKSHQVSPETSVDTPKVRRRWSFKRSTSTARSSSSSCSISFDSILPQAYQKNRGMHEGLSAQDAATKIQAVYRSYLARRALRALRGLVKLQALARGYLVRKQMNTVLKSVHAVMKIQVRARIHRIQMAEEPTVIERGRNSYRNSSASDRQLQKETSESTADANAFRASGHLRSRSVRTEYTVAAREECGCKICNLDCLPVSENGSKLHMLASPSSFSLTDSTSTTYDGPLEEFTLKKARGSSGRYYSCPDNKPPIIRLPARCPDYTPCGSNFTPNYMNKTESSKAKARSHSEPRQRPKLNTKQRNRRTSSIDGKNDQEYQYPWIIKLYRAGKFTMDRDIDTYTSSVASISSNRKSFIPFEPPMNLN